MKIFILLLMISLACSSCNDKDREKAESVPADAGAEGGTPASPAIQDADAAEAGKPSKADCIEAETKKNEAWKVYVAVRFEETEALDAYNAAAKKAENAWNAYLKTDSDEKMEAYEAARAKVKESLDMYLDSKNKAGNAHSDYRVAKAKMCKKP